jgi:cytochrome c oxidase subunit 2
MDRGSALLRQVIAGRRGVDRPVLQCALPARAPVARVALGRGDVRTKLRWVLAIAAMTLVLAGCGSGNKPQDTFDTAGPVAQKQADLFWLVFWGATAVFVVVEGGIVLIAIRYRHRKGKDRLPAQIHGNTRLEIGWTIAPALVLAIFMVPTVSVIWQLAKDPGPDALHVTVEGHQWWWGFQYTDPDMKVSYADAPIRVADTLTIPVGRDVSLTLESIGGLIGGSDYQADYAVIHSFWVPRLAGKQDVVPNQDNKLTLSADEPGTYWGQCAEFCGLQHGRMKFRVIALDQAAWDVWVADQKQPAAEPSDPVATQGMDLFLNGVSGGGQCIACHAIGGTDASSVAAPDLTHFANDTHQCFAGCIWETGDTEALKEWLRNPTQAKLGSKMPDYNLTEDEIDQLVAYLYSLK